MVGDFNAKSPTWGSPVLDVKGQQVEDILSDLGLITLNNKQNTYLSRTTGTESALDISAVSYHLSSLCGWKILNSAISHHGPIITTLKLKIDEEDQIKRSWNFRKADWTGFTQFLDKLCSKVPRTDSLEELTSNFVNNITTAAKRFIPRGKRKKQWVPYWKDHNIDSLIKERDNLNELLKTDNTSSNREMLAETTKRVEDEIAKSKRLKWADFCKSLDPRKDAKYWKIVGALNKYSSGLQTQSSNIISVSGTDADSNIAAANLLALHYSNASKLSFSKEDKKLNKTVRKLLMEARSYRTDDVFTKAITYQELKTAIYKLDAKKSPGVDLIFGEMIKHLGETAMECLLEIINLSWKRGKLPKAWKTSIIVPILKPGKLPSECKNYRPIALTSILCKITERIIHYRIMSELIKTDMLNFYQTAYRKQHASEDQLFYLCQNVIDGLQNSPSEKTTAVFLDMTSAFDTVWRKKLVEIAYKHGIKGNALIWIADFLRDRRIRVRYNGAKSKERKTWGGVPQGSVLSPLLFLLYVNNIHQHIDNDTKIACYADDIAIWHTCSDITKSESSLNRSLIGIVNWSKELKLRINPQKTNYTIFTTDRRHRKHFNPVITMDGVPLTKVDNPKYLGVTLDAELRFTKHIENISHKALKKLNILRSLCGTNWGANPQTLRTTYASLVRPNLEYASPIWAHASVSALGKLDKIQARAAKIIIGAVSSTNNTKAVQECGLQRLDNRRKYQTVKFINKANNLAINHISHRATINWNSRSRLKRSSTMKFDKEIRESLELDQRYILLQEPILSPCLPPNTVINLNLLDHCSKKEPVAIIKAKGISTIETYLGRDLVQMYTDGSSDETFLNGGAGISITLTNDKKIQKSIGAGNIASNFTCELKAILEALRMYISLSNTDKASGLVIFCDSRAALEAIGNGDSRLAQDIHHYLEEIFHLGKSCTFQWTPAHVGIEENEEADRLAKEARDLNSETSSTVTLGDANAIARYKLKEKHIKMEHQLCVINADRIITKTISRLRTQHFCGMTINTDGTRTYKSCRNCPEEELTPEHILNCPAIIRSLQAIDEFPFQGNLYNDKIVDIAKAVILAHGVI